MRIFTPIRFSTVILILFFVSTPSIADECQFVKLADHVLATFGSRRVYDKYATAAKTKPTEPVLRFLASSPNSDYRLQAVNETDALPAAQRVPILTKTVDDRDSNIRVASLQKLAQIPGLAFDRKLGNAVGRAISDKNGDVRKAALELLRGRNDPNSLQAIRHAIYDVRMDTGFTGGPWELLAMKRDAIEALKGRTDAGAVDLIDGMLFTEIQGPNGEYKPIPDWYSTLLEALAVAKEKGTPEVQEKVRQIVKAREAIGAWSDYALELLRTPVHQSWIDGSGGGNPPGYWAADQFQGTDLYRRLLSKPGENLPMRWRWDANWNLPSGAVRRSELPTNG